MTADEVVGRHHQLNGHEFERALRDSEAQGSLAGFSPQGPKESDITERLHFHYLFQRTVPKVFFILGYHPLL